MSIAIATMGKYPIPYIKKEITGGGSSGSVLPSMQPIHQKFPKIRIKAIDKEDIIININIIEVKEI